VAIVVDAFMGVIPALAAVAASSAPEEAGSAATTVLSLECVSREKAMPKEMPTIAAAIRPSRRR
jgi:hypothetical protein